MHNQEVIAIVRYKLASTLAQQWFQAQMFKALRAIWVNPFRIAPNFHMPVRLPIVLLAMPLCRWWFSCTIV